MRTPRVPTLIFILGHSSQRFRDGAAELSLMKCLVTSLHCGPNLESVSFLWCLWYMALSHSGRWTPSTAFCCSMFFPPNWRAPNHLPFAYSHFPPVPRSHGTAIMRVLMTSVQFGECTAALKCIMGWPALQATILCVPSKGYFGFRDGRTPGIAVTRVNSPFVVTALAGPLNAPLCTRTWLHAFLEEVPVFDILLFAVASGYCMAFHAITCPCAPGEGS